ncbi:alpha/beta hydrolase [Spirosoma endbachense]|uniref:Prolyl oligopeptidase family serine peptidase n=1 Tax=Spirosoma endbachense TaxID=2666025 RepID=A0A6P1W6Y9_9BACT|nr:alpha/beta hydrolase [Spirosoma endbachense]QHW01104.1 prolyl oligopeptidase family serine peptidase [Spirosoma endbachense]
MKKNTYFVPFGVLVLLSLFSACKPVTTTTPATPATSTLPERIMLNTAYGTHVSQKMDLYLPANRTAATKLVVMIHGGAWFGGDKTEMNSLVAAFRAKWPDCAVANINYRLANNNNAHSEEIMSDIKAAVNFIATNKVSFQISDTMGIIGASAGAQLALLYTYTQNNNDYVQCVADLYAPCVIDDWDWYNSFNAFLGLKIKDVLTQYNGFSWEKNVAIYHANSPYTQLNTEDKPTIVFHGTLDVVVPIYQSQWLHAKLIAKKVPNDYYEYLDGHGFSETNNKDCMAKTVAFFQRHMKL